MWDISNAICGDLWTTPIFGGSPASFISIPASPAPPISHTSNGTIIRATIRSIPLASCRSDLISIFWDPTAASTCRLCARNRLAQFPLPDPEPARPSLLRVSRHQPSRRPLHAAHDRTFLGSRKAETPNALGVQVVGRFRCGPARRALAGIVRLASRQGVARIIEVHDRLEALEIAVVTVGLHKSGIRPLVHVAQCRDLISASIVGSELAPSRIYRRRLAQRRLPQRMKKATDASIDERGARFIGDVAERVWLTLCIIRELRVGGSSDIARREIGEQRILARTAVAMTGVALCLAAEQIIARLLLRCELRLSCEHRVELGGERCHLG